MTTRDEILEALRQVRDPRSGRDIVSLGLVQGVAIKDGNAQFALEIDPADVRAMEPVRLAAERAVAELPGIVSATAVLTAERPAPGKPQPATQGSTPRPGAKLAVPGVRAIVAVASGKGGVGKSTTATNLACALARLGLVTGLLDADVYGPSQPLLLGLSGRPRSLDGKTLEPMENYGVRCMSIGFLAGAADEAIIWRGPMVMSALQQMLRQVNWGRLDVLVVDLPPGTGDAQLTMAQTVPLTGAIIVSTPQDIALLDARKGLNMFRKVDVPVLGMIENMSYFLCPHCGARSDIFSHGGAREEAARLGVEFLGEIPLALAIRETSDAGTPIVVSDPASPHAERYLSIAQRVAERLHELTETPERAPPRIVIE